MMNQQAANPTEAVRESTDLRSLLPVAALGVWLAAFWFLSSESTHRSILAWCVIPLLVFMGRELFGVVKSSRWLWLAAVLLGWQTLSRHWSGGLNAPHGWTVDFLLVLGLLCALLTTARAQAMRTVIFPSLAIISATISAVTMAIFYLTNDHNFADDRLQNIFFYEDGLNAVLTGFLFAFGALIAAWQTTCPATRGFRAVQISATVLSLFGLLTTQSRGPMLMLAVGLICLVAFERKRALPVLAAAAATTLVYLGVLLWVVAGREAFFDYAQRGSSGRFAIYHWFLTHMSFRDVLIGTGMARPLDLPEEVLGWCVQHPHSIYLTQFYQTGIVGTALLFTLIAMTAKSALALARSGESLWLCLLAGGCVALAFDGGQVFSVYSIARIEILLVAVPAAIAAGRNMGLKNDVSHTSGPISEKSRQTQRNLHNHRERRSA